MSQVSAFRKVSNPCFLPFSSTRKDQQGERVGTLRQRSAPHSHLWALSWLSLPVNYLPLPGLSSLSRVNVASGSSMLEKLRGTDVYVTHSSGIRCLPRTQAAPKKNLLLHAPLIKRSRERRSRPKGKEKAGLIYEAFRCLDGSLHPCSGNAALQCASRLTVLQHPGALL